MQLFQRQHNPAWFRENKDEILKLKETLADANRGQSEAAPPTEQGQLSEETDKENEETGAGETTADQQQASTEQAATEQTADE